MKKYLVSIIVPVYNVERYIEQCIKSLCSQTYDNIEIVLVDDGSSDNSGFGNTISLFNLNTAIFFSSLLNFLLYVVLYRISSVIIYKEV